MENTEFIILPPMWPVPFEACESWDTSESSIDNQQVDELELS